ncbi:cation transporter [Paenibacillus sp. MDMC362]|uniref:cation transporter n=1 Tax=Paenibacillus sp. MDMC362 TaxID=2977365 RepID=UPI000DC4FFEF|nr:cation transporter [Paenibacillus sp. MDMC362]RAR38518.1 heavy metal transporter [Paenibacillus sp. MDMC362]
MKKTYKLRNLDCANCAAKIENGIRKLTDVTEVKVNFMGQRMILEAPEDKFNAVLEESKRIIKKLEPDVSIDA